ncbi:Integrase, catalytic core [Cucumis melo var. makuwa]|uniref:Integrase, catalytic core n=1 Tax=Cucumis melo var. makuwa TaxID=1194695 RepID=A0A5A7TY39_CUCMM|nr:Integrase, catalytic core [Cucumis melo var. makuwa]
MSSYVKFLKDILEKKRRIDDFKTMALTQATSYVLKNGVPEKTIDPGSFMKLEIGEVQLTLVRFQFTDRSIAKPKDKIEDVLLKSIGWEYYEEEAYYELFNTEEFLQEEDPDYILEEVKIVSGNRLDPDEHPRHKIRLEEGQEGTIQFHRQLNHTMKEVVEKKIIKWLDTRVTYPIPDSEWRENCAWAQDLPCEIRRRPIKIDVESKLPSASDVKPLRRFLKHGGFYKRFIRGFFQITKPLSNLLCTNQPYNFDEKCNQTYQTLKDALTSAPILITPDWSQQFELMCDVSDVTVGAMLDQNKNNVIYLIYNMSKTLNDTHGNYTTT